MSRRLTSSLPCFVAFWFATVLAGYHVYCTEILRIYQNRISVKNMGADIETYEIVGLASVELESEIRPTYFFDCNTTENNGTGITWMRQSGELRFRVEAIHSRTNGKRLTASGITTNDLGVYVCLDTYSNTTVSVNITQDNPAVQPINRVLRFMQGSNATLAVYASGYPLVMSEQIHWYRPNGTEITEEDGDFEDERRSLVISFVQLSDAGVYMCQVNTPYGNRRTTIQLDVYGSSPLRVYQGRIVSSDVEVFQVQGLATVEFDNSVTYYLDCNTSRNDGSGIMWTRVGGNNPFQVSDVGTGNVRRLSLSSVRDSHLGSYLCYDTLSEDRATINITTDNPAVSAVSGLVEVLEGDNALLEVYASSYPLVTSNHISWYWPNGSKVTEDGAEFMSDGRALFLVNVKPSEAGVYRCEVNVPTTGQRSSAIIQLNIYAQPVIISHPRMISTATEWKIAAIQCDASGIPPPTITWEREGGVTPPTTTVSTSNDTPNRVTSVLMFNSVRYRDRGRYRCVADNSHTPQVKSDYALLRVIPSLLLAINISGEPQLLQDPIIVAEGSEVTLECTGSGKLLWMWSVGQEIPTGYEAPDNLYQEYISSREVQLLHIRNFSSSDVATYSCRTDLTTHRGAAVEIAVTLKGETIASTETTNPESQSHSADSAAAVVGGVLSGIILAILVVLFMLVITLVVQQRTKGSAPVAGVEVESGVPVDNGVNRTSVQELKAEENIQAGDSIEKLNDNSMETAATTTDKMDEIL